MKESIIHVHRDCSSVCSILMHLVSHSDWNWLFLLPWQNGIGKKKKKLSLKRVCLFYAKWLSIFAMTYWIFWLHHNEKSFRGSYYNSIDLYGMIIDWVNEFLKAKRIYKQGNCSQSLPLTWRPSPYGWIKINIDGSL